MEILISPWRAARDRYSTIQKFYKKSENLELEKMGHTGRTLVRLVFPENSSDHTRSERAASLLWRIFNPRSLRRVRSFARKMNENAEAAQFFD
jgi:hypothetical protein